MRNESVSPVVYWVVGSGTNVGKTTIATSLIKVLNARGERTVGFKPYAGAQLHSLIDFMIETYPGSQCKLFGKDALNLTTASPLTGVDLVDLVVPTQYLSHPKWDSPILMRSGSVSLNNVEYFCSEYGAELKDRADLRDIIRQAGLPFDTAAIRDIGADQTARLAAEKQKQAFDRLLDLGVDAVVCEGAAGWLPVWQDCPAVNHLIIVAEGELTIYPGLDLSLSFREFEPRRPVKELAKTPIGPNQESFSIPLYLVEEKHREAIGRQMAQALIEKI